MKKGEVEGNLFLPSQLDLQVRLSWVQHVASLYFPLEQSKEVGH